MSSVTVDFDFEIGDEVYLKTARSSFRETPSAVMIIERVAQECHGGVQRLYQLFGYDNLVPELVLTKQQPPFQTPTTEQWEAITKERRRDRESSRDAMDALSK